MTWFKFLRHGNTPAPDLETELMQLPAHTTVLDMDKLQKAIDATDRVMAAHNARWAQLAADMAKSAEKMHAMTEAALAHRKKNQMVSKAVQQVHAGVKTPVKILATPLKPARARPPGGSA